MVYGTIGGIFYGEKDIGPSAGIWDGGELLQPAGDDMAGAHPLEHEPDRRAGAADRLHSGAADPPYPMAAMPAFRGDHHSL